MYPPCAEIKFPQVWCSVLQYVAVCCTVLQCVDGEFEDMHPNYTKSSSHRSVAVCCNVLQRVAAC